MALRLLDYYFKFLCSCSIQLCCFEEKHYKCLFDCFSFIFYRITRDKKSALEVHFKVLFKEYFRVYFKAHFKVYSGPKFLRIY